MKVWKSIAMSGKVKALWEIEIKVKEKIPTVTGSMKKIKA